MAIKLYKRGLDYAKELVGQGRFVLDDRDMWSEHQPSTEEENKFIAEHGLDEYARWHLGVDPDQDEDNKGRYRFPYGDFDKVHRCGVLSAESRAAQRGYADVESAAAHLHGMLDAARQASPPQSRGSTRP